jgi:hypothetical protein
MGLFGNAPTPSRPQNPEDMVDEIQVDTSLIVATHPEGVAMLKELAGGVDLGSIQDKDGMDVWAAGAPQDQADYGIKTYILKFAKPIDIDAFNVKLKTSQLVNSVRAVKKTKEDVKAARAAAAAAAAAAVAPPIPPKEPTGRVYPKVPSRVINVNAQNYQGVDTPGMYQIHTNKNGAQFANFTVQLTRGSRTFKRKRVYGTPQQIRRSIERASKGVSVQELHAAANAVSGQIETLQAKQQEVQAATNSTSNRMRSARSNEEAEAIGKRLDYLAELLDTLEKRIRAKQTTQAKLQDKIAEMEAPTAPPANAKLPMNL